MVCIAQQAIIKSFKGIWGFCGFLNFWSTKLVAELRLADIGLEVKCTAIVYSSENDNPTSRKSRKLHKMIQ